MITDELGITVGQTAGRVSALLLDSPDAHTLYVLAHGAGASMRHPFMQRMAERLLAAGIATLRFNFPYMEAGGRRPDPPGVLEASVRAAIGRAAELAAGRRIIAGGKSMGGRMTSQTVAKQPDERVRGIAFLGFPLHQPGRASIDRAAHLADVRVPMLFVQGTRDTLARVDLIEQVCASLGPLATLHIVDQADHSFAVPKRAKLASDDVYQELATVVAAWAARL